MRGRSTAAGAAAQEPNQLPSAIGSAVLQLCRRVAACFAPPALVPVPAAAPRRNGRRIPARQRSAWRISAGILLAAVCAGAPAAASAKELTPVRDGTSSADHRGEAQRAVPLPRLEARFQRSVREVMDGATLYRRLPSFSFECNPELYLFLVNRPDVVVSTWNLLGVSDIELQQVDKNRYAADDKQGTTAQVDVLFRSRELHVVYAEGAYQGMLMPRKVKGRCVLLLRTAYQQQKDESWTVVHSLDCFVKIDNFGADLLARTLHATTTQLADRNFAEVTAFVQNLQSRLAGDGDWGLDLAGKLQRIRPEVRDQFADLVDRVYCSGWDLPDGRGRGPAASEGAEYARGPQSSGPHDAHANAPRDPRAFAAGDPRLYGPGAQAAAMPTAAMQPNPAYRPVGPAAGPRQELAARPEAAIRSETATRGDFRASSPPPADLFAPDQAPVVASTPVRAADRVRTRSTAAVRTPSEPPPASSGASPGGSNRAAVPEKASPRIAVAAPAVLPAVPSTARIVPPAASAAAPNDLAAKLAAPPLAASQAAAARPSPVDEAPLLVGPSLFDPHPSASRIAAVEEKLRAARDSAAKPSVAAAAAPSSSAVVEASATVPAEVAAASAKMPPGPYLFQPAPVSAKLVQAAEPVVSASRAASSDGWRSASQPRTAARP